jgi:hypothetical protein
MGFLDGLFGGGGGDPGPSQVNLQSRADALNQSDRLLAAYYGSNYRKALGSNYGSMGTSAGETSKRGWGDTYAKYNYAPQTGAGAAGGAAGGSGSGGNSELYGGNTPFGTMPIYQQQLAAMQAGLGENARTLTDYNQGAEGAMREAQQFGTGQNAVIESDAAKALKDANAATQARLQGMGLGGSTITTDALGANAAGNIRELMRAKANLAQQATGLRLQQRNTNTAGRANLQQSLSASNQNLRDYPIRSQLAVLGSPVANPFSVQGGTAPAKTSGLGGVGSLLGTVGGFALGGPLGAGIGGSLGGSLFGGGSAPVGSGGDPSYSTEWGTQGYGSNRPR